MECLLREGVQRPCHPIALALLACVLLGAAAEPTLAKRRDVVARTIDRLTQRDAFTAGERAAWRRDWRAARTATRRLDGAERANLGGVVDSTRSLARRRLLAGRARPAFLTLRLDADPRARSGPSAQRDLVREQRRIAGLLQAPHASIEVARVVFAVEGSPSVGAAAAAVAPSHREDHSAVGADFSVDAQVPDR